MPSSPTVPLSKATPTSRVSCVHAQRCAGCPLIEMPYADQLEHKRSLLNEALCHYPTLTSIEVGATRPAPSIEGYRVRAKLVVDEGALGLYAEGTHSVVDIPDCRVLSPVVRSAVQAVRDALPFGFRLLALDVREVDAGVLVTLVVPPHSDAQAIAEELAPLIARHPAIVGVALSSRAERAPQVLGQTPRPLLGKATEAHHLLPGLPYHLAIPGGFVQAHPAQASRLHDAIEQALLAKFGRLNGLRILELYAGAGALSLRLAARGATVVASDSFSMQPNPIETAARAQGLSLTASNLSAETALSARHDVDAILVDPPRRGLSPQVRAGLAAQAPELVAYVSCEPLSLARDLSHLMRLGFTPQSVTPWDMIPLSDAVETLVILASGEPFRPRVLYADAELLAVDKPAFFPTTPQGEQATSLLEAVRRLPDAGDSVPVHRLDLGTSGVCLFARTPDKVEVLSRALAEGHKEYLALVQGIARKKGRIERKIPDGAKLRHAVTRYERDRVVGTHSLVRALPEQGRRHQIRRHLAHIGHPVLGDARYGNPSANRFFEERHGLDRTFLHLERLRLVLNGQTLEIHAELAPELEATLRSLARAHAARRVSSESSVEAEKATPGRE